MLSSVKQLTMEATEFDRTIRARPTDDDSVFEIDISDAWASLVGAHGGFLAAVATRCAEQFALGRRARTVSTTFLRPGRIGPATIRTGVVRSGRSITTVTADIEQEGRTVTSSRLTFVAPVRGAEWSTKMPLDLPPPTECVPVTPPNPVAHFDRVDGLLDPSSLPFTGGDRAMVQGYIRPLEQRGIDAAWLAMATDWFPPPAFVRIDPPAGGISVDLTTHVHRTIDDHDGSWLTGRFEIETSVDGLAVEHGRVCTLDGDLLAESFQTRWTSGA
jgi:acyl-CoA thioesterase